MPPTQHLRHGGFHDPVLHLLFSLQLQFQRDVILLNFCTNFICINIIQRYAPWATELNHRHVANAFPLAVIVKYRAFRKIKSFCQYAKSV
jgi:hypothetical protein